MKNILNKKKDVAYFDLDRSLCVKNSGTPHGPPGEPIQKMFDKMRAFQSAGFKVGVLTARTEEDWPLIHNILKEQGIKDGIVTNVKNQRLGVLYDDKAVGVLMNEGITHLDIIEKMWDLLLEADYSGLHHYLDHKRWNDKYEEVSELIGKIRYFDKDIIL